MKRSLSVSFLILSSLWALQVNANFSIYFEEEKTEVEWIASRARNGEEISTAKGGGRTSLREGHSFSTMFARAPLLRSPFEETPSQPEGPFYPVLKTEIDTDLTRLAGNPNEALGEKIRVQGQVLNTRGQPVVGAVVEIWQACASGKYSHPRDTNTATKDENFQYYGTMTTDSNGHYSFLTIVPGPYPAAENWWRPPHIHFKVTAEGQGLRPTTTQLYFAGSSFASPISTIDGTITGERIDEYNRDDLILKNLSEAKRQKLIVGFYEVEFEGNNVLLGTFNIYLRNR